MLPEDLLLTSEEIAEAIKESGRTKEEVARLLGIGASAISKWVKGKAIPEPKNADAFRKNLTAAPTHRAKFAAYLVRAQARAAANRGHPPQPPPMVDPKALLDTIARDLADKLAPVLKVDVGVLAALLAEKFDAKGIAPAVAGQLLPDLRKVVEELAQKFVARADGQQDAVEQALTECAERVELLLKQNTSDVADAVVAKARGLVATLKSSLDAVSGLLRGFQAKADSQSTQDAQERAQLQAKADDLGNGVQKLHTKADDLGNKAQRTAARADAHHRESRIQFLALIGTMVAGFTTIVVTIHTHGPVSGAGLTRGGVAEDAARGGRWSGLPFLGPYLSGETGEKAPPELYIPDQPLPGQKRDHCNPNRAEELIKGGCWVGTNMAPPCRELYRHGNTCYRPVAADPDKPVGKQPDRSEGQETSTQKQPDVGMPGKEQE